jgi:hypothetical protein
MMSLCGYIFELFLRVRLTSPEMPPLVAIGSEGKLSIPVTDQIVMLGGLTTVKTVATHPIPFTYWPISTTFKSVDSIICTASEIILIQSTVGKPETHGVNIPGLNELLRGFPVRFSKSRNICLVFVTDEEANLVRLRSLKPPEMLPGKKNVGIYSCVLQIGQQTFPQVADGEPSALDPAVVRGSVINCDPTDGPCYIGSHQEKRE